MIPRLKYDSYLHQNFKLINPTSVHLEKETELKICIHYKITLQPFEMDKSKVLEVALSGICNYLSCPIILEIILSGNLCLS